MQVIAIAQLIPGGVKPTDYAHCGTNDGTCSRCQRIPPEIDVPLIFWDETGRLMWIYCEACLAGLEPANDG